MNVLFICNFNQNRSKTAEELFKDRFTTRSAGLYAGEIVTAQHLAWADVVIVMDDEMRRELAKRFPDLCLKKRILFLDVPDIYRYQQPELVDELKRKMNLVIG